MFKISKEVGAQLKDLAGKLPAIPVSSTLRMSGQQVLDGASKKERKTNLKHIDPAAMYTVKTPGSPQAVNHEKRLRSAYIQQGPSGVMAYLEPFKKKAK
jgi:hypothetical protein